MPLTFSPSLGHLPAGATKDITVTYTSEKPLQLKATLATLKASQLKMPPGAAASDWDNRLVAGSNTAVPEPKLEIVSAKEAAPVTMPLKVCLYQRAHSIENMLLFVECPGSYAVSVVCQFLARSPTYHGGSYTLTWALLTK